MKTIKELKEENKDQHKRLETALGVIINLQKENENNP